MNIISFFLYESSSAIFLTCVRSKRGFYFIVPTFLDMCTKSITLYEVNEVSPSPRSYFSRQSLGKVTLYLNF